MINLMMKMRKWMNRSWLGDRKSEEIYSFTIFSYFSIYVKRNSSSFCWTQRVKSFETQRRQSRVSIELAGNFLIILGNKIIRIHIYEFAIILKCVSNPSKLNQHTQKFRALKFDLNRHSPSYLTRTTITQVLNCSIYLFRNFHHALITQH